MAISRFLMNRQLQADGGIMNLSQEGIGGGDYKGQDMGSRTGFNILKKVGKRVRKLIPNEIANIAVSAAPFVAPFNPALAGAMAGIGSFDQTGNFGDAFKRGALTYGGGQAARYAGGAGFQGNPFTSGAFTPSGFTSGFSSPLGSDTGLGKFFSNRGTAAKEGVQAIDTSVPMRKPNILTEQMSELSLPNNATSSLVDASDMALVGDVKQAASQEFNLFKAVKDFDYKSLGNKSLELGKKFGKAVFYDSEGKLDRAAVMGAVAFAGSYAEALALANDAGVELTEEAYDEARKSEKQEEYAGYLTNFFAGQKDGGRIGYESGANEYITRRERQNPMAGLGLLGGLDSTIDESDQKIIVIMTEDGPQMVTESEFNKQMGIDNGTGSIIIDMQDFLKDKNIFKDMKKDGGRIGRKFGSPEEGESEVGIMTIDVEAGDDEDQEDMLMAYTPGFSSQEKSYLFRRIGAAGGSDRSYTMPQLYRILKNPGDYPEDAAVLKEIAVMGLGKKDGGRIGFKNGTGSSDRVAQLMLERDYLLSKDEDVSFIDIELERDFGIKMKAEGGIMNAKMPTGQMRKNNAGVVERDYRDEGGFVPVGIKERADDVPAMLSKNEFVMTADAVRGIGNGSVEEGSKKLYNTMKQAEKIGKA